MDRGVLVVLSGGQDSTTCLFWARKHFNPVHALTFNYGQRHACEIEAARKVASLAGVDSHEVLDLGPSILLSSSPLVNQAMHVGHYASAEVLPGGVEPTFIPGRNILFLTLAANRACHHKVSEVVIGVCGADYGGYFDCRDDFVKAMAVALNEGLYGVSRGALHINTPLMSYTKAESVKLAQHLEGCMEALAYSHTCYEGRRPPCGTCHACLLRARGFEQAGVEDPLIVRTRAEAQK